MIKYVLHPIQMMMRAYVVTPQKIMSASAHTCDLAKGCNIYSVSVADKEKSLFAELMQELQ